jgi:hypothetical protein
MTPEQDVATKDANCKVTSKDRSLGECLQYLLETAREANQLGEGRVSINASLAKKQDVTPRKEVKVSLCAPDAQKSY